MKNFIKQWVLPPAVLNIIQNGREFFLNAINNLKIDKMYNNRYQNIHHNDRCFIVGTGPSIKEQDLTLLRDEIVIGVSGLFQHKDIDTFMPQYYVLPPVFRGHGDYFAEEEFIIWLRSMDAVLKKDTVLFLDIGDKLYTQKYDIFKDKQIVWLNYTPWSQEVEINKLELLSMPSIWSVSESAIQVGIHLDFKEIYLLGFDHSWQDDIFQHFTDDYNSHFDEEKLNECKSWVDSEHEMIRHAKIFNKYKKLFALKKNIYNANANQNSYVDTFPKVKFESLFAK